jgi:hypothetical protein
MNAASYGVINNDVATQRPHRALGYVISNKGYRTCVGAAAFIVDKFSEHNRPYFRESVVLTMKSV